MYGFHWGLLIGVVATMFVYYWVEKLWCMLSSRYRVFDRRR